MHLNCWIPSWYQNQSLPSRSEPSRSCAQGRVWERVKNQGLCRGSGLSQGRVMGNSLGLCPWLPPPLSKSAILNISLYQYPKVFTENPKPIIWGTLCKNPCVGLGIWALLPACPAEEMQGAWFRPCSVVWAWGWLSLGERCLCHLQKGAN